MSCQCVCRLDGYGRGGWLRVRCMHQLSGGSLSLTRRDLMLRKALSGTPPSPAVASAPTMPSVQRPACCLAAGFEDKTAYAQCIFAYSPGVLVLRRSSLGLGLSGAHPLLPTPRQPACRAVCCCPHARTQARASSPSRLWGAPRAPSWLRAAPPTLAGTPSSSRTASLTLMQRWTRT